MESASSLILTLQEAVGNAIAAAAAYAPSLIAAILVLLAGWFVARFARVITHRVLSGANRLLDRLLQRGTLSGIRMTPTATAVSGEVSFWVIIFLSITIAARIAKLPALSGWLNQIAGHLPNLLVGAAIIVAGYFVSVIAGEQVTATARAAKAGQSALMGRFAQGAIFVTALIIGLDQVGVDVTFLVALFAVAVGAIFIGFSIAFGLGARDFVSNLIGARTAHQKLRPGVMVRIGGIEGEILEITPTQIALDTSDGRTLVPARLTEESGLVILTSEQSKGASDE